MSFIEDIWNGTERTGSQYSNGGVVYEKDRTINTDFVRNKNIHYRCKLRWNENKNIKRTATCWVCGKETSEYYSHAWRTQDGRIRNIKCLDCYDEYLIKKQIERENSKRRGSLNFKEKK